MTGRKNFFISRLPPSYPTPDRALLADWNSDGRIVASGHLPRGRTQCFAPGDTERRRRRPPPCGLPAGHTQTDDTGDRLLISTYQRDFSKRTIYLRKPQKIGRYFFNLACDCDLAGTP